MFKENLTAGTNCRVLSQLPAAERLFGGSRLFSFSRSLSLLPRSHPSNPKLGGWGVWFTCSRRSGRQSALMKFVVPQESHASPASFLDRCEQETPPVDFYLPQSLLRSQHPAWHNTARTDPPSHSEVSDSARFTTQRSRNLLPPTSPAGSYSNIGKKLETV